VRGNEHAGTWGVANTGTERCELYWFAASTDTLKVGREVNDEPDFGDVPVGRTVTRFIGDDKWIWTDSETKTTWNVPDSLTVCHCTRHSPV
jgi:hypothetical protein